MEYVVAGFVQDLHLKISIGITIIIEDNIEIIHFYSLPLGMLKSQLMDPNAIHCGIFPCKIFAMEYQMDVLRHASL